MLVESGGPPRGHDVDLGEQAQRVDGDGDQDEGAGGAEAGPGHVPEPGPAVGAVDGGGLVQVRGDGLQPGEPDHHVEADALPDGHEQQQAAVGGGLLGAPDDLSACGVVAISSLRNPTV
ncbi:hypothetical protein [Streptomyces sp. CB01881]|uniref:hypothetical protein n=1 Tax=Streptomyces sp. CB01881 TaxID=2078691 RepID=UPI001F12057D|nr:hypothetical protein [Streptomyces sp. CB01881]